MKQFTDRLLYYASKSPWLLLIPSIILSEIVTMLISIPMSYMLLGRIDENLYIAGTCAFLVSLIVCALLVYFARQSLELKNEIENLKKALNINEDGTFSNQLSSLEFNKRLKEELDRGHRHGFTLILMKIKIENLEELKLTLPSDSFFQIKEELIDTINTIKRSYDLLSDENSLYVILLNQVVKGCIESVCLRFYNTIKNHKFITRLRLDTITANIISFDIKLSAIEFTPTKTITLEFLNSELDKLLNNTQSYSYKIL